MCRDESLGGIDVMSAYSAACLTVDIMLNRGWACEDSNRRISLTDAARLPARLWRAYIMRAVGIWRFYGGNQKESYHA